MTQIARVAAPDNSEAAIVLGLLFDQAGHDDDALAAFSTVPSGDFLIGQARDARVRSLVKLNRKPEALQVARSAATSRDADASDYSRLGDVYEAMDRHGEAADAYLKAASLSPGFGTGCVRRLDPLSAGGEFA